MRTLAQGRNRVRKTLPGARQLHWRFVALALIVVINAANVGSLGLLVHALLRGGTVHGVKVVGGQYPPVTYPLCHGSALTQHENLLISTSSNS